MTHPSASVSKRVPVQSLSHTKISFIHLWMNQNLHVNKTKFCTKDFALRLALKQRRERQLGNRELAIKTGSHVRRSEISTRTCIRRRSVSPFSYVCACVSIAPVHTYFFLCLCLSSICLSPGQTDSQVDASFGLAFNLRFVWPPTCVDFGRAQIWTQVDANEFFFFNRLATQRKSTQVDRK